MSTDDREAFAEAALEHALAIGEDAELVRLALEATDRADRRSFSYVWQWLGVPIIQMPADIVAFQEVVWSTRPQCIIETGLARGGSSILSASLLQLLGEGIVVAIDIDVRSHNRRAVEDHPFGHRVRLVEGSSVDPDVVAEVRGYIGDASRVMVVLDSDHTHEHVLAELRAYAPLVTVGQFLIVADTIIEYLPPQERRPRPWGPGNNPKSALDVFLAEDARFEVDPHVNGKLLMTSSPGGYVRRVR